MRMTVIACAILFALPLSVSAAEICEDVNDISNGWNELANLIDQTQGDGFSEEEVGEIDSAVGDMTEGTATLAGLLQGAGNADQQALGNELEGVLTEFAGLTGEAEVDYAVSVIDQVTSTLDAVTDDCDAAHAQ
jgi:hypothetical protein